MSGRHPSRCGDTSTDRRTGARGSRATTPTPEPRLAVAHPYLLWALVLLALALSACVGVVLLGRMGLGGLGAWWDTGVAASALLGVTLLPRIPVYSAGIPRDLRRILSATLCILFVIALAALVMALFGENFRALLGSSPVHCSPGSACL